MNREEFIRTIEIIKTQPEGEKGFSFRRTIKTLQQAEKMRAVYEYQKQLIETIGADENVDEK